jgi:general secretion pathway protein G
MEALARRMLGGNSHQFVRWPFAVGMAFLLLISLLCIHSCGRSSARVLTPKTEIAAFSTALNSFRVDTGRLPSTAEGLGALITKPAPVPDNRWHGPYLDVVNVDPWGHSYVYRYPGMHNTNGFDLYSLGPDGVSKTGGDDPDDINNWDPSSPHAGYSNLR